MNTNIKKINRVYSPTTPHFVGDGFRVHNFIPAEVSMEDMDPFVMLDYNSKYYFTPSERPRGVGSHPHRGFETVTIAYKGKVEHADSSGGGGVIGEGDVQWMTAASGVMHKEYHQKDWSLEGGDFHMVQLWVNLPAKYKMSSPKYQAIANENINKFILKNETGSQVGHVEVIAGEYQGVKGSATTFSPINLFNLELKANNKNSFAFPAEYATALVVIEGQIKVNDEEVKVDHFVHFQKEGEVITIEALEDSVVLVMSGEPLNEPIAAYGPFVMNTEEEIKDALEDLYSGRFGNIKE
ncbi:MAG: quercetin 2,3-dioxygenase [Patescibacteria group bacterium]|nr:quercetin 2,3-dioxygenase [Patescibacteria group bacterium]